MYRIGRTGALAVALALALPACAPPAPPAEPGMPAAAPMTAGETAAFLTATNTSAVQLAELAVRRAHSPAVRQYAEAMLAEHRRVADRYGQLWTERGITAQQTRTVRDLEERNRRALESLRAHEGAAFDRAFLDLDIATQEWLMRTYERTLIPSARDRQVRSALEQTHTGLRGHVDHARTVQRGLR